ncbi:MAG: methyltransferase domain-containing protein [Edaphobacter sp.]
MDGISYEYRTSNSENSHQYLYPAVSRFLERIPDGSAVMDAGCFALLKPGGIIVITTPYHGYLKNLMLAVFGKMDSHFTVLWDHGHIKFWSRRTLAMALTEVGFRRIWPGPLSLEEHGAQSG